MSDAYQSVSVGDAGADPSSSSPSTAAVASPPAKSKVKGPTLFDRYFSFVDRWKRFMLVAWVLVGIGSAVIGPRFFNATSASSGDAPGTPVYEANQIYSQYFPDSASTNDLLILLIRTVPAGWPASDSSVLTPLCASVTSQVLAAALAYPDDPNMFRSLSGYFVYAGTNYSDLASEFVTADQTATMITVSYDANGDVNDFIHYFEDLVRGGGITYPSDTPPNVAAQYEMSITGLDLLFDDTVTGSEKDFITMDGVVLPVALIVLALYLRNLRMMVIPLASVGLTLLTSFTIMYPIALYGMTVASFAPSIMVSTAIALSIDYSLFLLTRYREERLKMIVQAEKKRMKKATMAAAAAASPNASSSPPPPSAPSLSPQEEMVRQNFLATKAMLRTAGHVVFVSGTTLMLTFMGLVFFPLSFLQSVGVGAAFALLMCLVVNLNLTPVLLLTFPGFFGTFRLVPQCLARRMGRKWTERIEGGENVRFQRAVALAERHAREEEERKNGGAANGSGSGNGVLLEPSSSTPLTEGMLPSVVATDDNDDAASSTGDGMDRASLLKKQAVSFWFRSATFTTTTRYSFLVIFFVLALSLPFSYFTLELKTSSDVGLIFPRNSLALAAFQELNARFRPGFIDPFHVIAVASQSGKGGSRDATKKDGCWNEDFFLAQQGFIQGLVAGGLIANDSVTAISYFKGNEVSFTEALAYLDPSSGSFDSPAGYLYRTIVGSSLNADRSVTLMNLVTSFNPDGDNGPYWVDTVRGMLSLMQQQAAAKGLNNAFYLNGGATDDLDSYRKVNSLFPTLVALTVCCVFLIVAVLFRSFLVPLRLLFTIGLSITFVYGFAVLVFQRGMFDWLSANLRKTNTIFWMETIMTFSILTGLGLDYDVFLFSRVREYKLLGYSTRASIIKAIYSTGEVITVAGSVMGIAFGGLMSSSTMVLNQFGFLLCFAVLFDTFVIRTLLVPAMLHLFGRFNWYPGKYPQERYGVDDFVEGMEGAEDGVGEGEGEEEMTKGSAADSSAAAPADGVPTLRAIDSRSSSHQREMSKDYQFLTSPTAAANGH